MTMYLNPKLVSTSFWRLAPKDNVGKGPMERTSALMIFLAFDAVTQKCGCRPLDSNPDTLEGKNNRAAMKLDFTKLVSLKLGTDGKIRHVAVLGKVKVGGLSPEKRISSNFFTVPVKKASQSAKAYDYPNRPSPLLKMGKDATGINWGIDYHKDWRINFPEFLTDMRGNTPFTDLGVFVFRNVQLPKGYDNVQTALACVLKNSFSEELAQFWSQRMALEKVFFKHGEAPFCDSYQDSLTESEFSAVGGVSDRAALQTLDKAVLIDKIVRYEILLAAHDIEFEEIEA